MTLNSDSSSKINRFLSIAFILDAEICKGFVGNSTKDEFSEAWNALTDAERHCAKAQWSIAADQITTKA